MALAPASKLFQHPGCPFSLCLFTLQLYVKSEMGGSECECGAAERRAAAAGFLAGS